MVAEEINKNIFTPDRLRNSNLFVSLGESEMKILLSDTKNAENIFFRTGFHSNEKSELSLPFNTENLTVCNKVNFTIKTSKFVIVPASFFDTKASYEYLQQVFEIDLNSKVTYKHIRPLDAFMVYQFSKSVNDQLSYFSKKDTIIPEIDCFVDYIHRQSEPADFYLNFDDRSFMMYTLQDDRIVNISHHQFNEAPDAVYLILNVLSRFNIDPVTARVVLSGSIMPYSELYNNIFRFIGELSWFKLDHDDPFLNSSESVNPHTFAELYCLSKCV